MRQSLKGRDILTVGAIPNWSLDETVILKGEFLFPGIYTIGKGESLQSLIERAGGFTDVAFVNGAQYRSAVARDLQSEQLDKVAARISRRMDVESRLDESSTMTKVASTEDSLVDKGNLGRVA